MADLIARTPCEGLLPLDIGEMTLSEIVPAHMTSLAPFRGEQERLSDTLKFAHDLSWPAPNRAVSRDGASIVWFGRGQAILIGPRPHASLDVHAALTDQSDAWAVVRLDGDAAEAVLARLVPVDLRRPAFGPGQTVRSTLMHMMASVTRLADGAFQIMVFRSMAQTLVHDLKSAMEAVAARG